MTMRSRFSIYIILLSALYASGSLARVEDKDERGFYLRIEKEINAPAEKVYRQFINIGQWWDASHTWFGDSLGLRLEAKAGGCFCEQQGDKSVLHMIVSYVDPGKEIKMLGGLGPLQGMGLHGAMSFRFEPLSKTTSKIIHEYRVTGYAKGGLQDLADIVNSVQSSQLDRLKAVFELPR